ncbi:MAG: thermonuclease family protein [Deltaproteobacteria bacterium]|jgi:site-specific DNA-methyltransferase (adenine-specific)|nr:thermonuclease family protein [Deltaproteobacteria bacterium]MCL5880053.1 thermonuclease family protein [Deltaproteobacteria bacterium]
MKESEDESIHLIITSPPYWQLKDYGIAEQIGFNDSYESYINNLNLVWKECYRVLHKGCRLCINIGDQFARAVYYGRYKVIPIRTEIIKFCETIGFDYMGAIIWQKVTTSNTTGGATIMGSFPYPRNGILKLDYEFILIFKKDGTPPKPAKENKELSRLTKDEWNSYFQGHWNFAGAKQDAHIAMFPEELPKRLIKMFSFVGDTVLDPFLGSGTTSLAAKNLNRNSAGYEINPNFIDTIKNKLGINHSTIKQVNNAADFNIINGSRNDPSVYQEMINRLPYIFKDPHKFNKKVDLKKLQFGSKIDKNSGEREEYFTVKEVISPEFIKLNKGLTIKLLGIKQNPIVNGKALAYLIDKLKGQKVFLRYDSLKYDNENNLLCYLYLQNKTFINAHLIKEGLVAVDTEADFKYKERFINLNRGGHAEK